MLERRHKRRKTMDIKRLAKAASLPKYMHDTEGGRDALAEFARLVAEAEREACKAECRKIAAQYPADLWPDDGHSMDCKASKMVEAKRYGALADEIDRLRGMVGGHDDLSQALIDRLENLEVQAVREIAPGWVGIPTVEWDSIMGPNV